MNLKNNLMDFRQAYLKAIAKTWNDEEFKDKIVSTKGQATNIFSFPEFCKLLPSENCLNWKMNVAMVFNEKVSYNPYSGESNNGWHGGADVMIIKIPENPFKNRVNGVNQESEALSAFYERFSNVFGTKGHEESQKEMKKTEDIQKLFQSFQYSSKEYLNAMIQNTHDETGDGGDDNFFTFGSTLMNIVANCWNDHLYFEHLTSITMEPVGQNGSTIKDTYLSFSNPWAFRIKFERDQHSSWDDEDRTWTKLSNNELYLQYPSKPKLDVSEAQAIARYNATGPSFPLTCA